MNSKEEYLKLRTKLYFCKTAYEYNLYYKSHTIYDKQDKAILN